MDTVHSQRRRCGSLLNRLTSLVSNCQLLTDFQFDGERPEVEPEGCVIHNVYSHCVSCSDLVALHTSEPLREWFKQLDRSASHLDYR